MGALDKRNYCPIFLTCNMSDSIRNLQRLLDAELPDCVVALDPPHDPSGNWWIDVRQGTRLVTAEYRPGKGFGIFSEDVSYGDGPTEIYQTVELVVRRLRQLLKPGKAAASNLTLKEVRELFGVSQTELADKAGVK